MGHKSENCNEKDKKKNPEVKMIYDSCAKSIEVKTFYLNYLTNFLYKMFHKENRDCFKPLSIITPHKVLKPSEAYNEVLK